MEREVPLNILNGIRFMIVNKASNKWSISPTAIECIKKRMATSKYTVGKVEKTVLRGIGNVYIFNFTSIKHPGDLAIKLEYTGGELYADLDAQSIDDEDVREKILDDFFWAMEQCAKMKHLPQTSSDDGPFDLEEAMKRMSIGKGRKTRRHPTPRATRRRKTDLHNRRR